MFFLSFLRASFYMIFSDEDDEEFGGPTLSEMKPDAEDEL